MKSHIFSAALFRQITDPSDVASGLLRAENPDGTVIGIEDIHDHPDGGGFTAAVGPYKTVNAAFRHGQRQVIHRNMTAESFGDTAYF